MTPVHEKDIWQVSAGQRAALLRKYQTLAAWRRLKDADPELGFGGGGGAGGGEGDTDGGDLPTSPSPTTRAALRALSRDFPGALRELDVLGLAEITRRIARLSAPSVERASGAASPTGGADDDDRWMAWIVAYHATMKAALAIKRAAGRHRQVPIETEAGARERPPHWGSAPAGTTGDIHLDDAFVRAVLRPPAGRLGIVVLNTLAAHFGVPASEISHTLFPPRRPAPYTLSG